MQAFSIAFPEGTSIMLPCIIGCGFFFFNLQRIIRILFVNKAFAQNSSKCFVNVCSVKIFTEH